MAEIQLERKEGKNWLWIVLGLVLLALIAWWLLSRGDDDGNPVVTETPGGVVADTVPGTAAGTARGTPGAVNDFIRYVEERRARADADLGHDYTADGIRHLAGALTAIVDRDTVGGMALRPRVDSLRQKADSLQRNAQSTQHAGQTRDAFNTAVAVMDDLRQRQYPNVANHVTQARQAAQAVQPGGLLLEQKAAVQRFFDHSAEALRNMANTQGSPALGG